MDDAPISPDAAEIAQAELGEPDAVFAVSLGRLWGRLLLGVLLVVYGVASNVYWWGWGPARPNHVALLVLIGPPLTGISILRHIARMRGLRALVYPSGLLRVHGSEVESFPWDEVAELRLKAPEARFVAEPAGAEGEATAALVPRAPRWKIGDAWLEVRRLDGASAAFTPALADFPLFVELVQRKTFPRLWAEATGAAAEGLVAPFGPFALGAAGLIWGDDVLPWPQFAGADVKAGRLRVHRRGGWRAWNAAPLEDVADPHVALALMEWLRDGRGPAAP